MKLYFVESAQKHNKYTYRTLYAIMDAFGVQRAGVDDADVIMVSVDDPDDMPLVRRARKIAGSRPLIAGGFEAFGGEWLLAFCDAVCVGEGFEFFEKFSAAKTIEDIYELPHVMTASKQVVIPSTRIDAEKLPVVRLGPKLYYYLAGRGCHGKCAFCMTGFAYPGWENSPTKLKSVGDEIRRRSGKLTFITNDSRGLDNPRNAQSVRVVDYMKNPARFKGASMLHFGIEGFSEPQRKYFLKPISDVMIRDLIDILGDMRQDAEFFFIIGFPGTYDAMMSFAEKVPVDARTYPRIFMKFTQFNPCPHTPLWSYDARLFEFLTDEQLLSFRRALTARNIRFRLFPMRGNARSLWRTAMRRASPSDVIALGKDPGPGGDPRAYIADIDARGLGHLLTYDGRPMPSSQIISPWRGLRDGIADRLGMMPISYKADS